MIIILSFIIFLIIGYTFSSYLSKKLKIYDFPSKRKIHKKPVLCIGGIYFFCAILFSVILYFILKNFSYFAIVYETPQFFINLLFVSLMILLLGVADDKISVNSLKKILFLFLINFFFLSLMQDEMRIYEINSIIAGKIILNDISSVFLTAVIFTIFIVFMGLIDGINCLLSSISIFLLIILSFYINYEYFSFSNILLVMLVVFLSFFLIKNYNSNVFLGNSGSMILPFIIATLYYTNYEDISGIIVSNIEIMLILIWLIIFDVLRVFINRMKNNKSPLQPDKSHFHHFLIKRYSLIQSLIIYLILNFMPIILILFFII